MEIDYTGINNQFKFIVIRDRATKDQMNAKLHSTKTFVFRNRCQICAVDLNHGVTKVPASHKHFFSTFFNTDQVFTYFT